MAGQGRGDIDSFFNVPQTVVDRLMLNVDKKTDFEAVAEGNQKAAAPVQTDRILGAHGIGKKVVIRANDGQIDQGIGHK